MTINPETPAPTTVPPSLKIRRSICWAVLWVVFDGFVMGQFTCAMLCAGYVIFYALPRALIAYKNRERRNYWLMRAAVFGAVPVIVAGIFTGNLRLSERNAEIVIAAVDRYHAEHKQYPQTLQMLVPKYLPGIPTANYAFAAPGFKYFAHDNRYSLMYTTLPPFGRKVYDFTKRSWSYID